MQKLTLARPDDWHLHLRDGAALKAVLPHTMRQFARAIIMPNLKPPVRTVADAAAYRDRILAAIPAGQQVEPLMTLYLTDNTSPEEIIWAKEAQFVKAVKYYPAGATTNSDFGVTDIRQCDRNFHREHRPHPCLGNPPTPRCCKQRVPLFPRQSDFIG